jgi:hypothetical protein
MPLNRGEVSPLLHAGNQLNDLVFGSSIGVQIMAVLVVSYQWCAGSRSKKKEKERKLHALITLI